MPTRRSFRKKRMNVPANTTQPNHALEQAGNPELNESIEIAETPELNQGMIENNLSTIAPENEDQFENVLSVANENINMLNAVMGGRRTYRRRAKKTRHMHRKQRKSYRRGKN